MLLGLSFYLFLTSVSLNALATVCVRFGVSWYALQETGSAAVFAAMIAASTIVEVYSKPLLAPLADYFNRLRVFRVCVVLSAVAGCALFLAVFLLPFSAPLLTALLVVSGLIAALREPTGAALIPSLVSPERMTEAQSLRSTATSIVAIAGPMVAGLVLAYAGVAHTLAVAAAVTVAGFISCYGVSERVSASAVAPSTSDARWAMYMKTWHHRTLDGLRAVWMSRSERNNAIATALFNTGLFPFVVVVLPVWAMKTLGGSAAVMAYIEVSFGVGILVGSSLLATRVNEWLGRFTTLVLGALLTGVSFVVASLLTALVPILLCLALAGIGVALYSINVMTLRSVATPASFRARMVAGVGFLSMSIHPFALQGFGVVIEHTSAPMAVAVCGAVILVAALVLLSNTDARSLLAKPNEKLVGIYQELYPAAFAERK